MNQQRVMVVAAICFLAAGALQFNSAMAAEVSADTAFQTGITAFQAKQYERALAAFRLARSKGLNTTQLTYDLGVTYYRLGRYPEAKEEFAVLAKDPSLAPLAHYNLGLIARKMEQAEEAGQEFSKAYDTTRDPKLRTLAGEQLQRLGRKPPPKNRWIGFIDANAGYTDNASLSSDSSLTASSQKGSALLSLLAGGKGQITGDYRNGLQAAATFYRIDYPNVRAFSQNDIRAGAQYRLSGGPWSALLAANGEYITLGGRTLETLGGVKSAVSRQLTGRDGVNLIYRYDHIAGGSFYNYLSGWRQSLALENVWRSDVFRTTGGYRFELNRRKDLTNGSQFFSESPTRQRVYADLYWQFVPKAELHLGGRYQYSRYNKPNVIAAGGTLTTITRSDRYAYAQAAFNYKLTEDWRLGGGYEYMRNDSNLARYRYVSNRFMASLEFLLH